MIAIDCASRIGGGDHASDCGCANANRAIDGVDGGDCFDNNRSICFCFCFGCVLGCDFYFWMWIGWIVARHYHWRRCCPSPSLSDENDESDQSDGEMNESESGSESERQSANDAGHSPVLRLLGRRSFVPPLLLVVPIRVQRRWRWSARGWARASATEPQAEERNPTLEAIV